MCLQAFVLLLKILNGMVINSGNWVVRVDSMLVVEALAVKKACEMCVDLGWSKVIVESDCKILVDAINNNHSSFEWKCSALVEGVLSLATECEDICFVHVNCLANKAANWMDS